MHMLRFILVFKQTEQKRQNKEVQEKEKRRGKNKITRNTKKVLFRFTLKKGFEMEIGNTQH